MLKRAFAVVGVALLTASIALGQSARPAPEPTNDDAPPPRRAYDDFDREGFYLGLGGSYNLEFFDLDEAKDIDPEIKSSTNAWGYNAKFGYRIHPHVAAELSLDYYEEFEFETSMGGDRLRLDGFHGNLSGKGYILTGRFQPYVSAGAGFMYMELNRSTKGQPDEDRVQFAGRLGPGIDIYLTRDVLLFAEAFYVLPTGDLWDYRFLSCAFGAQFRF